MWNRRIGLVACGLLMLSACGEGGDDNDASAPSSETATLNDVSDVFRATGGDCETDETNTAEEWIGDLAEYQEDPYFEPGTKGFEEEERRIKVLTEALSSIPADTAVTRTDCSTPGSSVYSEGTGGTSKVIVVYVCCDPDQDLVRDLERTGAPVDPSPLPDDGSNYEPA